MYIIYYLEMTGKPLIYVYSDYIKYFVSISDIYSSSLDIVSLWNIF